ncbi:MAG: murein transglycosylase A [Alphaproteobacteria bacterium]
MAAAGSGTAIVRLAAAALALTAAACGVDPNLQYVRYGDYRLEPTQYAELGGWQDDTMLDALPALLRSCEVFARVDPARPLGLAGRAGSYADWQPACAALTSARFASGEDVRALLEQWFLPFRLTTTEAREGFVTGYAEVSLRGSLRQTSYFQYPIYGVPPDMLEVDPEQAGEDWPPEAIRGRVEAFQLVPYYDRTEIENGALAGRGLELAWVDDPLDLFELDQQGEGVVVLDTGERRRVTMAGDNGYPRGSIIRTLIARDILPREGASWALARAWLQEHPDEARSMMRLNRRLAFFAWSPDQSAGPSGAMRVPLTPGRSIAVDTNLLPMGVPLWIDVAGLEPGAPRIRRLVVAQDVESGVEGFISGALFWGAGEEAQAMATAMNSAGRMFVLLPRSVAGFGAAE